MVAKWKKVTFSPAEILKEMVSGVAKYVGSRTSYMGEVQGHQNPDGTYSIYVESPNTYHYDLPDLFKGNKHFHLICTERVDGRYDWASGVYFKDCDYVHFELKP